MVTYPISEIVQMIREKNTFEEKVQILKKFIQDKKLKEFLEFVYNKEKYIWFIKRIPKDYRPIDKRIHIDLTNMQLRRDCNRIFLLQENFSVDEKRKLKELYLFLENLHSDEVELFKQMIEKRELKGISEKVIKEVFPDIIPIEKPKQKKIEVPFFS